MRSNWERIISSNPIYRRKKHDFRGALGDAAVLEIGDPLFMTKIIISWREISSISRPRYVYPFSKESQDMRNLSAIRKNTASLQPSPCKIPRKDCVQGDTVLANTISLTCTKNGPDRLPYLLIAASDTNVWDAAYCSSTVRLSFILHLPEIH